MRQAFFILVIVSVFIAPLLAQTSPKRLDLEKIILPPDQKESTLKMTGLKYIFLETKYECLVDDFSVIKYINGCFYINNLNNSHSIIVFNDNGSFLYKIEKYGRGPGEYSETNKFDVDEFGNVFVLVPNQRKIIKYSAEGKNYEEFKLDYLITDFILLDKDKILITNPLLNETNSFGIGLLNLKDNSVTEVTPFRKPYDDLGTMHFSLSPFNRSNNKVFFNPHYSNIIYESIDGKIKEAWTFSAEYIPKEQDILNIRPRQPETFRNLFSSDKYVLNVGSVFETSNFITMTILKKVPNILIISKTTDRIICTQSFNDKNYLGENNIKGSTKNDFFSSIPIKYIVEKDWNEKINQTSLSDETKNKLKKINETSNPVIVLFRFQDF